MTFLLGLKKARLGALGLYRRVRLVFAKLELSLEYKLLMLLDITLADVAQTADSDLRGGSLSLNFIHALVLHCGWFVLKVILVKVEDQADGHHVPKERHDRRFSLHHYQHLFLML